MIFGLSAQPIVNGGRRRADWALLLNGGCVTSLLYFLGDSHVRPVQAAIAQGLLSPYECRSEEVGGATAVGLRHPTSKTQALSLFRDRLEPFDLRIIPIFQLGEVDCGFVIWIRAQRHGDGVKAQLDAALEAYGGFLREMRDKGYVDLIVSSATLPTIRDGQLDGQIALLRAEVKATQRERTDLTLEYNDRLQALCAKEQLQYVDLTPDLLNPDTRLLHERFRHPDPNDHHLNPATAGPVWAKRVLEAVGLARPPY